MIINLIREGPNLSSNKLLKKWFELTLMTTQAFKY